VILVDTSVWVEHATRAVGNLAILLDDNDVLMHPFVIGELAMGNPPRREPFLRDLLDLPRATVASDDEVLAMVRDHKLFGRGIGYVDAHLLASAMLMPGAYLWTKDQRLEAAALQLKIAWIG
jgi:predicted nucleic acid-binding protein